MLKIRQNRDSNNKARRQRRRRQNLVWLLKNFRLARCNCGKPGKAREEAKRGLGKSLHHRGAEHSFFMFIVAYRRAWGMGRSGGVSLESRRQDEKE